ncbi:hypothetical protein C2G38_2192481 [Gigaspora rosea]|uniref:Uncharacterized protein n=1 Tax=Gigaspora rosea TaxID=44941 RepID=A0A397UYS2_9GLOM|nr:hypothetical protein C2G38_2192481 [Gigaspora rosea]
MDLESSHEFAKYWLLYECPISLSSEDVRDEKVCVLRCIPPVEPKDIILWTIYKI